MNLSHQLFEIFKFWIFFRFIFKLLLFITRVLYLRFNWFFLLIEALDLNFLIRPNWLNFGTVRIFLLQQLIVCFRSFSRSFLRFFCMIAYVWLLLIAYDRLTEVWRVELLGVMSANHLHQQYKASSHVDHIFFIPSFMHWVSPSNIAWVGCDNMWVFGK